MGIILSIVIGIIAVVLGSVAVYRTNHPTASSSSSTEGAVTLTGTETLTNKTLIQPSISRLIGSGSTPTVSMNGSTTTIATPTLSARSTDMAGHILSNGLNNSNLGFVIDVTFSSPYPVLPSSILVTVVNADVLSSAGVPSVNWNPIGFQLIYSDIGAPIPNQGGTVPFWNYLVIG